MRAGKDHGLRSMDGVAIRPASPADLPAALDLIRTSGLPTRGAADLHHPFLVGETEGKIVGTAGLEIYGEVGLLRSVAVAPDIRGQGLGARLVDVALTEATGHRVLTVALLTTTAAPFFERLGFRAVDRSRLDPRLFASAEFGDELCTTATAMVRTLTDPRLDDRTHPHI